MQPQLVNIDAPLVFERVGPFPAVLVLGILPFWPYTFFEEVVVGFQSKIGTGGNVVLSVCQYAVG